MFSYDGENKIITLTLPLVDGEASFKAIDLYSDWKEWLLLGDNAKWLPAFSVTGGEPINPSGTQVISPYFFLINGWKIRPQEEEHLLVADGNLLTDNGANPFIKTLGDFNVLTRTILSVNSTTTTIGGEAGGSVWTVPEKDLALDGIRATYSQRLI